MITQLKVTVKSMTEGGGHLQAIPQAYPGPCSPFEKAASFITNYISLHQLHHTSKGYRRLKGWTHVDVSRPQCSGHLLLFLCPVAVFVQVHTPSLMESTPAWTPARGGRP